MLIQLTFSRNSEQVGKVLILPDHLGFHIQPSFLDCMSNIKIVHSSIGVSLLWVLDQKEKKIFKNFRNSIEGN
jgi:hypothetical protein